MSSYNHPYNIAACRSMTHAERQGNEDRFKGRLIHLSSIAGLHTKQVEIQAKLEKELARKNPDVKLVARLQEILANINHTLTVCDQNAKTR